MSEYSQQMYRIQPKENVKFVEFYKNPVNVEDQEYWFRDFINSDKYKIHEVIVFKGKESWDITYHVWYESKMNRERT
ncbi:hypothetical protein AWU65_03680 [Paenibacillus glucanolyticus]|uniref:Uncharacterized protein n=1 Tax=Paenibacillus glucanolyticus TaxID=59843 RepID=A0A163GQH0_9BACL|nr:hypothetical protein AWU65_03680 [Paenibacillus glucanolyticus]OMF65487.1 hypothetical protein BK142_30815 [Paenibacillus glucanolyticus]